MRALLIVNLQSGDGDTDGLVHRRERHRRRRNAFAHLRALATARLAVDALPLVPGGAEHAVRRVEVQPFGVEPLALADREDVERVARGAARTTAARAARGAK